jgi:TPR repeat protein
VTKRLSILWPLLFVNTFLPLPLITAAESNLPSLAETKLKAEGGDPVAQDRFAEVFLSRLNFSAAAEWFRKAAERGVVNSQWRLGQILLDGRPKMVEGSVAVAADKNGGIKWLLLAANQGHQAAQLDLSRCFERGNGLRQDYVEAYKWCKLASAHNSVMEKIYLDPLILKMSSQQIAAGEERVHQFAPHLPSNEVLPEPIAPEEIVLKGISGTPNHRFAMINNKTFEKGEEGKIKFGQKLVRVKVLEITETSATILIEGTNGPTELKMRR